MKFFGEERVESLQNTYFCQSFLTENLKDKLNWKFLFLSLKEELDSKMNREGMKDFRGSEKVRDAEFVIHFH